MKRKVQAPDIEIMSPVGSRESLVAAVQGGAGSVYFGVGRLNMRAHSSVNFTLDDLADICRYCHDHQVKTYLTVNTVIYDEELDEMRRTIDAAKANGVDALIISDQATMDYARQAGMEIHLSTQLNISNTESLKFYAQWADVVVLARELNLDQVKQIAENIGKENICGPGGELIRIEMFVHGALCMAISGKCYLSLHEYNKSANRGSCYQVCRRAYEVTDLDTGSQLKVDNAYIMSPKDLMTLPFLDKLLAAGVRVLKIEGRARPPEYVKTVTECYREAVEAVANDDFTP
jgi:putative protease